MIGIVEAIATKAAGRYGIMPQSTMARVVGQGSKKQWTDCLVIGDRRVNNREHENLARFAMPIWWWTKYD